MLLYHGSNSEVDEPRLIEQTRGLDFGSGFYLTTGEEQANRFSETNGAWLEFVKDNRMKQYSGAKYDVVIGAVANDDVLPTIILYINGQLDANLTIGALKTRKLTDQVCLKTDKALSLLRFVRSYKNGR
ncbi:MAG: DUF3990 domain-containing protein [Synergistaceae bacterium]|jgi:hypothetical protein|nr:DUF3990 domain-containing protein [Synergistaceae bacterium]